jgi:hypothetical protein
MSAAHLLDGTDPDHPDMLDIKPELGGEIKQIREWSEEMTDSQFVIWMRLRAGSLGVNGDASKRNQSTQKKECEYCGAGSIETVTHALGCHGNAEVWPNGFPEGPTNIEDPGYREWSNTCGSGRKKVAFILQKKNNQLSHEVVEAMRTLAETRNIALRKDM